MKNLIILTPLAAMAIRIFAFLMVLISCCARAADIDAKVERILAKEDFSQHALEISSGGLDGSGLYHLAIVVDSRNVLFLYFIRESTDGRAEVLDHVEVGSTNARPIWSADIKRKSVFISVHSSGGCCSHSGMTYQLMFNEKRQLILVGYEEMTLGSNDGQVFFEDKLSLNLITGEAITSHAVSEKTELWTESAHFKPSWRMFKLLPPIKAKMRKFRVHTDRQWSLQNVSSYDEEFSRWVLSTIYGVKK